jgi:hypothetical protein
MNKCLERVNERHFWNPGVFSYAMIPRWRPNSKVLFFMVTSIVYGETCLITIAAINSVPALQKICGSSETFFDNTDIRLSEHNFK